MSRSRWLLTVLLLSFGIFFVFFGIIFFGKSPSFSIQKNIYETRLSLFESSLSSILSQKENEANTFLEKTSTVILGQEKIQSVKNFRLPEGVRYLYYQSLDGRSYNLGKESLGGTLPSNIKGFSLNQDEKLIILALPLNLNRVFQGTLFFAYDAQNIIRQAIGQESFKLQIEFQNNTLVFQYTEDSLSHSLESKLQQAPLNKPLFFSGQNQVLLVKTLGASSIRLAILYRDTPLGIPNLSLAILLFFILNNSVLLYANYRQLKLNYREDSISTAELENDAVSLEHEQEKSSVLSHESNPQAYSEIQSLLGTINEPGDENEIQETTSQQTEIEEQSTYNEDSQSATQEEAIYDFQKTRTFSETESIEVAEPDSTEEEAIPEIPGEMFQKTKDRSRESISRLIDEVNNKKSDLEEAKPENIDPTYSKADKLYLKLSQKIAEKMKNMSADRDNIHFIDSHSDPFRFQKVLFLHSDFNGGLTPLQSRGVHANQVKNLHMNEDHPIIQYFNKNKKKIFLRKDICDSKIVRYFFSRDCENIQKLVLIPAHEGDKLKSLLCLANLSL